MPETAPEIAIPSADRHRLRATLIGFVAVLLWAALALFTTATGGVPPFLLLILAGKAQASVTVLLACALIVGGAVVASRDLWNRRAQR